MISLVIGGLVTVSIVCLLILIWLNRREERRARDD